MAQTIKKIKLTEEQLIKGLDHFVEDVISSNAENGITEESDEIFKDYMVFVKAIIEDLTGAIQKGNKNLFTDFIRNGWGALDDFIDNDYIKQVSETHRTLFIKHGYAPVGALTGILMDAVIYPAIADDILGRLAIAKFVTGLYHHLLALQEEKKL